MLNDLKTEVCQANKDLVTHGLVILTWGKVSADKPLSAVCRIDP